MVPPEVVESSAQAPWHTFAQFSAASPAHESGRLAWPADPRLDRDLHFFVFVPRQGLRRLEDAVFVGGFDGEGPDGAGETVSQPAGALSTERSTRSMAF